MILKSPAFRTLRIQFRFSSANGCHSVLLTVDDSFQRNCCASTAYLEGNEGFLAYFSSSILPSSLFDIINPLMGGAQCLRAEPPCLIWCVWSLPETRIYSIRRKDGAKYLETKGPAPRVWVSVVSSHAGGGNVGYTLEDQCFSTSGICNVYSYQALRLSLYSTCCWRIWCVHACLRSLCAQPKAPAGGRPHRRETYQHLGAGAWLWSPLFGKVRALFNLSSNVPH